MLYNLDPLLGPELLMLLRSMGHGDEIAIVDANFPAESCARRLVRLDGLSATRVLEAVVSVLPLDTFVESPVHTMQVVGEPDAVPDIVTEFHTIIDASPGAEVDCASLERFQFYQRVEDAFAVVATSERRLYGNVILKKGIIELKS